jgi:hypothetical protein
MRAYEKKFLRRRFLWGDNEYADGYRSLLDLLGAGLECFVHNSPDRPRFISVVSPLRKMGGDNADGLYPFAPLAPGRRYRVRGTLGAAVYLGFTIYGGDDNERFHLVSNLSTPDVQLDGGGGFELVITPSPTGSEANVLRTDQTARCLLIRRYYLDKAAMASDPGIQDIEPLDAAHPPGLLTGAEMERQIKALSSFLRGWVNLTPIPMPPVPFAYNRFTKPRPASTETGHWSTPDNHHSFGLFRLKDDEALFVRGRAPECIYWSVQLWNPYLQTFDYVNHPTAMNSSEVQLDPDGSFELCIASRDPGHRNWLSTTGKRRGMVYFRFLKATSTPTALEATVRPI